MTAGKKRRVLFVCVGNCCRSQMAEGAEKNIDISGQYSKALRIDQSSDYDLIVNMSGFSLPEAVRASTVAWIVPDPIGQSDQVYARVRDQIEGLVLQLISDFRQGCS